MRHKLLNRLFAFILSAVFFSGCLTMGVLAGDESTATSSENVIDLTYLDSDEAFLSGQSVTIDLGDGFTITMSKLPAIQPRLSFNEEVYLTKNSERTLLTDTPILPWTDLSVYNYSRNPGRVRMTVGGNAISTRNITLPLSNFAATVSFTSMNTMYYITTTALDQTGYYDIAVYDGNIFG